MRTVEDMETAAKLATDYDYIESFSINSYIDAYDGSKWCCAQITDLTPNFVNIHFEAWGNKYDENGISKKSMKLAAFRFHSVGYTGQLVRAYRDFKYNKKLNTHNINELTKLISTNFDNNILQMTAYNFTQIYRGDIYFYADSLLSMANDHGATIEDLPDIMSFVENLFSLIVTWIKYFPKLSVEYTYSESYEFLYLVDFNTAVARMYPELAELLRLTFGETAKRMSKSFDVS